MASFGEPTASQPPFILPEPFLSPPAPPPSLTPSMGPFGMTPPLPSPPPIFSTSIAPTAGGTNNFPLQSPPPVSVSGLINEALKYLHSKPLLTIEVMMVLAIVMSCIMFLGSARKFTSNALLKKSLWVTVVSTPLFISYCVGQMTNGPGYLRNELFFIWGVLLLTGLAGYGTISAFELGDNETALVAHLQGYLKCTFVFGILVHYNKSDISPLIQLFLNLLVPLILLRLYDRAFSLAFASKTNLSQGVGSIVELVAEYTEWDVQKTVQEGEFTNPMTMQGYRYLVGMKYLLKKKPKCSQPCLRRNFEEERGDIVTTEDIWQCEGELLSPRGGDPEGRLKDTCLSFALFWMLLRRYIGYPLVEVTLLDNSNSKTWNFVRYGLISDISSPAATERAFRLIEQELSFLYDYFYTKNFVIYMYGTRVMFLRFLLMVAYVGIAQVILKNDKKSQGLILSDHLRPIMMDKIITWFVIYTMLIFELVLMIHYLLITQWSKVAWVCTYVQKKLWTSQTWKHICLKWAIKYIICYFSLSKNFGHWKGEIGQYSLLLSHDYFHPMYYFAYLIRLVVPLTLLDIPKWGRWESKSIPCCVKLKEAVLSSLHTNGRKLSNGKSSLERHGIMWDVFWACNLEMDTTHTILVWHIATNYCELNHQNRHPGNLRPEPDYLFVATSLSKYCAYLVAFAPELLPDQRNKTFKIINYVIWEANEMFKGCSNMEGKYEKMRTMTGSYTDAGDSILKKGIFLGILLVGRMSTESLWLMLGEFWAELLLYLAPSDDVNAHVEHLADGGEFITHLWALLTHAGILKRD